MKKKELAKPQKMFVITIILMVITYIMMTLVYNLSEYWEFFQKIWSSVKVGAIIFETILFFCLIISIGLSRANGYQFTANISLEDASQDFNEAYEKIYLKYSNELKKIKGDLGILEVIGWIFYTLAIFSWGIGFFFMNISQNEHQTYYSILLIFALIGLPAVLVNIRREKRNKYFKYFKEECMKEFLENMNIEYSRIAPIGIEDKLIEVFNNSGSDSRKAILVQTDDYIAKIINEKKIELIEAYFAGTFNREELVLFSGLFGHAKLDKVFNYRIRIKNCDLYENNDLKRVELNNSNFEQTFFVYSDDNLLPSGIIPNELMEIFVKMYEKYGVSFEININKDLLTIKFYTGKMLEPTIVGNTLDKRVFLAYYSIIEFATELMYKTIELLNRS